MICYSNFFINSMDLLATKILDFIRECNLFFSIANQIVLIVIFIFLISISILTLKKDFKTQKNLEDKIPPIVTSYYKNKYQAVLENYSVNLGCYKNSSQYNGSGYVYIDDTKTKYIYLKFNSKFKLININDNIEDDIILNDIEEVLLKIKKKHNTTHFKKLIKIDCISKQYPYNNISEYFTKNKNISIALKIVHNVETDNFSNYYKYCGDFAKDIYSILKREFGDINIDVGIFFVKSEEMYNYIIRTIDKCENSDDISIISLIKGTNHHLIKNDNYYYYIFDTLYY